MDALPDLWDIYDFDDEQLKSLFDRLQKIMSSDSSSVIKLRETVAKELQERGQSACLIEESQEKNTDNNDDNRTSIHSNDDGRSSISEDHKIDTQNNEPAKVLIINNSTNPSPPRQAPSASTSSPSTSQQQQKYKASRKLWNSSSSSDDDNDDRKIECTKNDRDKNDHVLDEDEERRLFHEKREARKNITADEIKKRKTVWTRVIPATSYSKFDASKNFIGFDGGVSHNNNNNNNSEGKMMFVSCGAGRRAFESNKPKKKPPAAKGAPKNTSKHVDKFRSRFASTPTPSSSSMSSVVKKNPATIVVSRSAASTPKPKSSSSSSTVANNTNDNKAPPLLKKNSQLMSHPPPRPKSCSVSKVSATTKPVPSLEMENTTSSRSSSSDKTNPQEEVDNVVDEPKSESEVMDDEVAKQDEEKRSEKEYDDENNVDDHQKLNDEVQHEHVDDHDQDHCSQTSPQREETPKSDLTKVEEDETEEQNNSDDDAPSEVKAVEMNQEGEQHVNDGTTKEQLPLSTEPPLTPSVYEQVQQAAAVRSISSSSSSSSDGSNKEDDETAPSNLELLPRGGSGVAAIRALQHNHNHQQQPNSDSITMMTTVNEKVDHAVAAADVVITKDTAETVEQQVLTNEEKQTEKDKSPAKFSSSSLSRQQLRSIFPNAASLFVSTANLSLISGSQLYEAITCVRKNIQLHLKDIKERAENASGDLYGVAVTSTSSSANNNDSSKSKVLPTYFRVQRSREEVYELLLDVCETKSHPCHWIEVGEAQHCGWNLWWSWSKPNPKELFWLSTQRVNRLPQSSILASKRLLVRSLNRMNANKSSSTMNSAFDIIMPSSFRLPGEYSALLDFAYEARNVNLRNDSDHISNNNNDHHSSHPRKGSSKTVNQKKELQETRNNKIIIHRACGGGFWICKPVGQSRGRGIFVLHDLSQLEYNSQVIVQRYVDRPLIVHGRKVDLRLYVLVTGIHPLEVFISRLGFVRFAMKPYPSEEMEEMRRGQKFSTKKYKTNDNNNNDNDCSQGVNHGRQSNSNNNNPSVSTMKQRTILQKYKKSLDMNNDDEKEDKNNNGNDEVSTKPRKTNNATSSSSSLSTAIDNNKKLAREDVPIVTSGVDEGIICDPFAHLTNTSVAQEFLSNNNNHNTNSNNRGLPTTTTKWSLQQLAYNWDQIYEHQEERRKRRRRTTTKNHQKTIVNDDENEENEEILVDDDHDESSSSSPSWPTVWKRICQTVLHILAAGELSMEKIHRGSAFELFGFDILLDEWGHPWVLEVNSSPSMDRVSELDEQIKPKLIDEILSLTQPPAMDWEALLDVLTNNEKDLLNLTRLSASSSSSLHHANSKMAMEANKRMQWWEESLNRIFPNGVSGSTPKDILDKKYENTSNDDSSSSSREERDDDDYLFYGMDDGILFEGKRKYPRKFESFYEVAPTKMSERILAGRRGLI